MSFEFPGQVISLEAGVDLSANQHHFVTMAADFQVDPTGAGLKANGVQQNNPDAVGQAVSIMITGVTKMVAGAAVAANVNIASDSTGRAVLAAATDFVLGTALEVAGGAGEVIAVQLHIGGGALLV